MMNQRTSDQFVNSYLAPETSSFFVGNLRNSPLLRAISASNLTGSLGN